MILSHSLKSIKKIPLTASDWHQGECKVFKKLSLFTLCVSHNRKKSKNAFSPTLSPHQEKHISRNMAFEMSPAYLKCCPLNESCEMMDVTEMSGKRSFMPEPNCQPVKQNDRWSSMRRVNIGSSLNRHVAGWPAEHPKKGERRRAHGEIKVFQTEHKKRNKSYHKRKWGGDERGYLSIPSCHRVSSGWDYLHQVLNWHSMKSQILSGATMFTKTQICLTVRLMLMLPILIT